MSAPRVGLVLGAGGVLGGAWLSGALDAIATESGWDPGSSRHIVGTSAGSLIGALLACGVPPWLMVARSSGEDFDALLPGAGTRAKARAAAGAGERPAGRASRAGFPVHGAPSIGPGSWRLALSSLARPYRHSPAAVLAGWLPNGPLSTQPISEMVGLVCEEPWAPHPNFWAIAVDYASGRRVAFGRRGAPHARLPDAVAASCAIPGFFRAVEIGGRRYVDGGIRSVSNLDVLAGERLDLVVALNPMSSLHRGAPRRLGERVAYAVRTGAGRRLGSEAKRLRAAGIEVILIQPTVHDLDAMGSNLMSRKRRTEVMQTARRTVREHLRSSPAGEALATLPAGQPQLVRRPSGPRETWAPFAELARARFAKVGEARA